MKNTTTEQMYTGYKIDYKDSSALVEVHSDKVVVKAGAKLNALKPHMKTGRLAAHQKAAEAREYCEKNKLVNKHSVLKQDITFGCMTHAKLFVFGGQP